MRFLILSLILLGVMGLPWLPSAHSAPIAQNIKDLTGAATFSPRGDYLVAISQNTLRVWHLKTQTMKFQKRFSNAILDISFTPDQAYLAVGTQDGHYTRWDFPGFRYPVQIVDPPSAMVAQPFALSPDGRYLALFKLASRTASKLDFHLNIWDLYRIPQHYYIHVDEVLNTLPGHFPTLQVAWHPLGRYLSTAIEWDEGSETLYKTHVQVWDSWEQRWAYAIPGSPPIAYSQNGKYFFLTVPASAYGPDFRYWNFKLWHTPSNRLKTLQIPLAAPAFSSAAISPDGLYLAFLQEARNTQKQVFVVSTQNFQIVQTYQPLPGTDKLSFSPDHRWLAVSSQVEKEQEVQLIPIME